MKLKMPVTFIISGFYEVEADSIEEGMEIVREHEDEWVGYHDIGDYQMVPANDGDLYYAACCNMRSNYTPPIYKADVKKEAST